MRSTTGIVSYRFITVKPTSWALVEGGEGEQSCDAPYSPDTHFIRCKIALDKAGVKYAVIVFDRPSGKIVKTEVNYAGGRNVRVVFFRGGVLKVGAEDDIQRQVLNCETMLLAELKEQRKMKVI